MQGSFRHRFGMGARAGPDWRTELLVMTTVPILGRHDHSDYLQSKLKAMGSAVEVPME